MTATVRLDVSGVDGSARVFAVESDTGNLAWRTLREVEKGWRPQPSDFRHVYRVRVRIEHEGRPVAAAAVTLQDRDRTQNAVLAPADNGLVTFYAVRHGDVRIAARYTTGGITKTTPTLAVRIVARREEATPTFAIAIVDPVETVTAKPAKTAENQPAPRPRARDGRGSVLGTIIVYLAAAALGLGAILLGLRLLQRNPALLEEKLKKLGVEVAEADEPVALPPVLAAPQGQIMLPDAEALPAVASGFGPRLVGETGESFGIEPGETEVGREASIVITDSSVSRRHAMLIREGDAVRLRDLGSTNGTFVNGARVEAEVVLNAGDMVQFGTRRYRYES